MARIHLQELQDHLAIATVLYGHAVTSLAEAELRYQVTVERHDDGIFYPQLMPEDFSVTAALDHVNAASREVVNQCEMLALAESQLRHCRARLESYRQSRPSTSEMTRRLVFLAGRVVGRRRSYLREAWAADLHGGAEAGLRVTDHQRLLLALGFVIAAVRMRASDVFAVFWRPVDWLLSREERTNALITATAGALAIYFAVTDGVHALLTADWQSCAGLSGGLYVLVRWLRGVRGIELAARQAPTRDE